MQVQLLKDIISDFAGEGAAGIVDLLFKKKNVNEFLIAKKLDLTINQTRNILYKLSDEGLVSFIRKKDSKKGGWYTYFWTLNSGKSLIKFRNKLNEETSSMKEQLELRKNKTFYYSAGADLEYTEEEALLNDYICPETGEVLEIRDSTEIVVKLESEIERLGKLLEEVNVEIGEVEKKDDKARKRRFREEVKRKEEERIKRKKKREREAKKAGTFKYPKKKVAKKSKKKVAKKSKKAKKVKKK